MQTYIEQGDFGEKMLFFKLGCLLIVHLWFKLYLNLFNLKFMQTDN